ncbi:MobC family plasmid mobilization relaxosome protein [Salmonella enterica]|nr:MobC family plasmid mobilization relaxosome protein [Salmonella enterica]EKT1316756.1 MobC family plasmid mobilization relaxosome protein [Salmonella enterica]EKT1330836.1 MobC family plasmid mobilization relaxosome protein [Salmonella enterica]EKT1843060.1 MobC family plasmid mobilization relaxosome protein [Salmonella enterica]EKT1860965.1 MobC family plasmid mobilization relaxosome protein [Salmonella enterica]
MSKKRDKMLTMWVTQDEHQQLLELCDGKQLPSIDPVLLRQLAGMGNNLNQIARKINGGQVLIGFQVVAALMAIDASLEQLRHTVRENGGPATGAAGRTRR